MNDEDYEEPEPAKQPRCKHCGVFLPWKPNSETRFMNPNGHWDLSNDTWVQDGPDIAGPLEPIWKCSVCDWDNTSEDLFK